MGNILTPGSRVEGPRAELPGQQKRHKCMVVAKGLDEGKNKGKIGG